MERHKNGTMTSMDLTIKQGNIFDSQADALINPINCVGVMGGGLALAFKQRYPRMFNDYRAACKRGRIATGHIYPWIDPDTEPRWIINFPTKDHWRDPSTLTYIRTGLDALHQRLTTDLRVIKSIAIPALGCGLGGLDWDSVKPLIVDKLSDLDIMVELYPPTWGEKIRSGE